MKDKKRAGFPRTMLYALIGVTAGIYLGFYFLGYDNPYVEDPNFNAPVLTDFLIGFLMMLLVAAFGVGVWAVVRGLKERDKDNSVENGVRVAHLLWCSWFYSLCDASLVCIWLIEGNLRERRCLHRRALVACSRHLCNIGNSNDSCCFGSDSLWLRLWQEAGEKQ